MRDSSLWPYSSPSSHGDVAPSWRKLVRLIADGYYPPPYPAEPGLSSTHGPTKMNVASIPHAAAVWPASLSFYSANASIVPRLRTATHRAAGQPVRGVRISCCAGLGKD